MNILEYAKIFQEELDKQMVIGATSGWMEPNSKDIKYSGGNEVKVPIIEMDGLGDYDRDKGFVEGAVTLEYKTLTMTMDRGRTFQLDAMDVNETNFVASAANVMGEFQATRVVPEIDAYRYSTLAAIAFNARRATSGYTPTESTVLKELRADIYKIWDDIGDQVPLIISLGTLVGKILEESPDIQKKLDVGDFKKGEISTKVKMLDDIPLLKVPSLRLKTEYLFKSGKSGQEAGGFEATAGARDINWLITAKKAPMAISKTDTIRIYDPMTNQKAHAWKIDYRKYHDIWVKPNSVKGLYVNTK